ncbi:MAG: DUF2244 domain-containing protein [Gammaproteobacteria bacterium]|nr:MAG: DUF2244 domain-containing protein [Gammaproteobacteria bacterium]
MVASQIEQARGSACIEMRPNSSLSEGDSWLFCAALTAVLLALGVRFYLLGAWLVMPFCVIELAVLLLAYRHFLRRNAVRERVLVEEDRVTVSRRDAGGEREWSFQRYWLQVHLLRQRDGWYPSRLLLRSHGRELEIGRFLTEEERQGLAEELIGLLRPQAAG